MKSNPTNLLVWMMAKAGIPLAFNNGAPTWKMDGDKVALKDGNPVFLDPTGNEMVIGLDTISKLNNENKQHRLEKETLATKLKDFEGLDPKAAREAFDKLSKIDQKKLIDAGEVDKVREEIGKSYSAQISEKDKVIETLTGRIKNMMLDGAFNGSEFLRNNIAIPLDFIRAAFGGNFTIENDKITAKDKDGNVLYSRKKAGEVADFEEAIQMLVDMHPQKDTFIKTNTGGGTGSNGGGGNPRARTMRRADFEKLPAMQQAEHAALMRKGELTITD